MSIRFYFIILISSFLFSHSLSAKSPKNPDTANAQKGLISSIFSEIVWGDPIDTSGLPEAQAGDDRQGYRSDVTSVSQKFYNDMKRKLASGGELNFSERIMVNFFIATRRWPDAPSINADDRHIQKWVEEHFKKDRRLYRAEIASSMQSVGGHYNKDSYMSPDLEKFRQFFYNTPPEKRTILMKTMMNWYRSQGYDMRTDAAKKKLLKNLIKNY